MTLTTEQYTEGLCGDGTAILHDGLPMSVSEILAALNAAANQATQPLGYIDPGNLKTYRGQMAGGSWSPVQRTLSGLNLTLPIYLAAQPAPVVPDGYCIMPLTLTAENGAKYALSGEFKVSRTITCNECGGEGCDDCGDAGEFEEEITIPWDTIKDIYRAAVDICSMSSVPDAVDIFADQVIGTKTKIIRMPAPLNVPQEGIRVYLNADELFMHLEKQGYIVEVSNE